MLVLGGTAVQISVTTTAWPRRRFWYKGKKLRRPAILRASYAGGQLAFFLLSAARNWLLQYTGQQVLHDLRNSLFSHIQKLPISFF